jgi:hypothetical protein
LTAATQEFATANAESFVSAIAGAFMRINGVELTDSVYALITLIKLQTCNKWAISTLLPKCGFNQHQIYRAVAAR